MEAGKDGDKRISLSCVLGCNLDISGEFYEVHNCSGSVSTAEELGLHIT